MNLLQDLRYAFRMLLNAPGFTAVAVLSLALGIGANTAIFSVINAILLKQLPVHHPEQLAVVGNPARVNGVSNGSPRTDLLSYPLYQQFRDRNQVFTDLVVSGDTYRVSFRETSAGSIAGEPVRGRLVSGNYFSVLGVPAVQGRTLLPDDDRHAGAHPVVVISYGFWKRRFGLDPGVVGKVAQLNGSPFTIIGVTPPEFFGEVVGAAQDFWAPLAMQEQVRPGRAWLKDKSVFWLLGLGRLKPGVTLPQAEASLLLLYKQIMSGPLSANLSPGDFRAVAQQKVEVHPGGPGFSAVRARFSEPLLILMALVALVLLVACANVANLLLARATARRKEVSVRLALGAGRWRLIRQFLTESLLLGLIGGGLGLLLAQEGSLLLVRLAGGGNNPARLDLAPDWRVLAFTLGLALLTGLLFGFAPALQAAQADVAPTLKSGGRGLTTGGSRFGLGKLLVIGQVALSLLLLIGAGLFVRSLQNLQRTDLGYRREHVLMLPIDPVAHGYKGPQVSGLYRQLQERFSSIPGVQAATFSANGLFGGQEGDLYVDVEGYLAPNEAAHEAYFDQVGPGYFSGVGIPLVAGREITAQDNLTSPKVAVINESMARFYFGQQNPIGKHILLDEPPQQRPVQIIGVCRDVRDHNLRQPIQRRFYLASYQEMLGSGGASFMIRTIGDPPAISDALRREVRAVNSAILVPDIRTLTTLIDNTLEQERLIAKLASFFGIVALLLASIGLYGTLSYSVARRTSELGVRVALGAGRAAIIWMILRETLVMLAVGAVAGTVISFAAGRAISSKLFGLSATDPLTVAGSVIVLSGIAILAGYVPARRAASIHPLEALRYD